ncbi:MAG TPA: class I tRNA ligase family protein, partial [Rhabdochlamydiaceae bacterium]
VEKLKEKGLIVKIDEAYTHEVPVCYKCEREIEPQVKRQWFIKTKELAKPAVEALERGEITFYPEHFKKILLNWLSGIEDWNISRQIVWGIPIPVWYKGDDIFVGEASPGDGWTQDSDTFDTWFSSGQWPFATLGFPASDDFKTFYPTQVMETGGDLIFFWVSRMIMLGLYRTGKVPFSTVYLHGMVVAKDGKKMSKSKGNVISPLEMSEKFGTDALRMGLIIGNTPGTPTALYDDKIKAYKLFANKIWNITRFVLMQERQGEIKHELKEEFDAMAKDITKDIEEYRFYLAGEKLYHYVWDRFAAQILEESKGRGDYSATLYYLLENSLKLLHPFMPFITEEIWGSLPGTANLLMVEPWPLV